MKKGKETQRESVTSQGLVVTACKRREVHRGPLAVEEAGGGGVTHQFRAHSRLPQQGHSGRRQQGEETTPRHSALAQS